MAKVRIPTPLRTYTQGSDEVVVAGATVGEVLTNLSQRYDGIGQRLFDKSGAVHRFINIFLNKSDIRREGGLAASVGDDDVISIFPAIAGGR
ncbi:MAG: MoaD/ThiS family protein [Myxococcales bacterium]|nr:MoaD/ThiS family protein [Myxococcales bacterium]